LADHLLPLSTKEPRTMVMWEELPRSFVKAEGDRKEYRFYRADIIRAKIPGGWLVMATELASITFVRDPQHRWDGNSLD
jgi:hypothetical protein